MCGKLHAPAALPPGPRASCLTDELVYINDVHMVGEHRDGRHCFRGGTVRESKEYGHGSDHGDLDINFGITANDAIIKQANRFIIWK
jgi:hypothetical protein